MNLSASFEPQTKEQWLQKVQRDLGERDLADLDFELFGGRRVSPFYHLEDRHSDVNLPFPISQSLAFQRSIHNEREDNGIILQELIGGARALYLRESDKKSIDWPTLLDGVLVGLIDLYVEIESSPVLNEFQYFIKRRYSNKEQANIHLINRSESDQIVEEETMIIGRIGSDTERDLLDLLVNGHSCIANGQSGQVLCFVQFDNQYFANIIKARAVRMLWSNLCIAMDADQDKDQFRIIGAVDANALTKDKNDNMIRLTQMTASMLTSGMDFIFIPHADITVDPKGSEVSRQLSRNIFHMLTMESHVDHVSDPSAGSYFFDYQTTALGQSTWEKFIGRD